MTAGERPASASFNKKKRPFGVNAIIVLSSLSLISAVTMLVALYVDAASVVPALASLQFEPWLTVYLIGTAVVQVAIVIGLWRLERWGWFLVMLNTGFGMFLNIWAYFNLQPNYVNLAASVLIVFYMNQREVQQAFVDETARARATSMAAQAPATRTPDLHLVEGTHPVV